MKSIILFVLTIFLFRLFSIAQTVSELTDKKDIVFARNLLDWQLNPVDSLMFDIYYPTGAAPDKKYPVYFSLHGGSFTSGTKLAETDISDPLADKGFIVIAPDYRVGYPNSLIPCIGDSANLQEAIYRAMQDVNACMRYVTNHADLYNIDTNWVFVGGSSAGGTLALNLSYVTDSLAAIYYPASIAKWGKLQNSGNSEPYNYKIKGICGMWGCVPYWDSLINSKSAIPAILFKGKKDTNLPDGVGNFMGCPTNSVVRAGAGIYSIMTALHVPCVYHLQVNAAHIAYDNDFCVDNTACFFKGLINNSAYSGYYEYYDASCR